LHGFNETTAALVRTFHEIRHERAEL